MVAKNEDGFYFDYDLKNSIGRIHSFYGNFSVIARAWIYIKMLGDKGLKRVAENSVINSNYLMNKIKKVYPVPFDKDIMHEFVASGERFKDDGIKTLNIAKRLLDYGFHAPTVYFPLIVKEALMIEPTETESKETIDEFADAMFKIADEAKKSPEKLLNAPSKTPVGRLDEIAAIKRMDIRFDFES